MVRGRKSGESSGLELQGGERHRLPGPRGGVDLPYHSKLVRSEQANERWLRYVNLAESYAEPSKDPEIQTRLAALKHEWDSLKSASNGTTGLETPQAGEDGGAELTGRKKRAIGRPTGSGSLERGDLELVEEMRSGITTGEYLSIAAAAKAVVSKAGGAGTYSSKEKRLTKRYSERHPL